MAPAAGPAGRSATTTSNARSAGGIQGAASHPPDPAFARLLMALLLSLRGSVCLYQGEELGLTEADLREADLRDPFGIAYWPEFRGRDGSRTPMPWCAEAPHAGFTTGDRPWLPVPPAHPSGFSHLVADPGRDGIPHGSP